MLDFNLDLGRSQLHRTIQEKQGGKIPTRSAQVRLACKVSQHISHDEHNQLENSPDDFRFLTETKRRSDMLGAILAIVPLDTLLLTHPKQHHQKGDVCQS